MRAPAAAAGSSTRRARTVLLAASASDPRLVPEKDPEEDVPGYALGDVPEEESAEERASRPLCKTRAVKPIKAMERCIPVRVNDRVRVVFDDKRYPGTVTVVNSPHHTVVFDDGEANPLPPMSSYACLAVSRYP